MCVNKVKGKGKRASNNDYFLLYRVVEIINNIFYEMSWKAKIHVKRNCNYPALGSSLLFCVADTTNINNSCFILRVFQEREFIR